MDLILSALSNPSPLEAASKPDGLPEKPGLYAWWTKPDALPMVPLSPRDDGLSLIYIGIAQSDPKSAQTLRSRVLGKHIRGVIGNSTLRRTLAALLWEEHGWNPSWATDRARLSKEHNDQLGAWMHTHLQVAWLPFPEPWTVEDSIIVEMKSPLNLKGNKDHPFYPELRKYRDRLDRIAGRTTLVSIGTSPVPPEQFAEMFVGGMPIVTTAFLAKTLGIDSKELRKKLRALRDQGKIADRGTGQWTWTVDSPELRIIWESYGKTQPKFGGMKNWPPLTPQQQAELDLLRTLKDEDIDLSDAPELDAEALAKAVRNPYLQKG